MGDLPSATPTSKVIIESNDVIDNTRGYSLFLPHGAPPIPIEPCKSSTWLETASLRLPNGSKPTGIIFMSPHHYEDVFTVSSNPTPEILMDFDEDTNPLALEKLHKLTYPVSGYPELALKASRLLIESGIPCNVDSSRGLDHGIWTPLYVMFPKADIPVVSLSVRKDLDVEAHIKVGKALAKLVEEGVLLLGSGEVVHNITMMGKRDSTPKEWCTMFETWLDSTMKLEDVTLKEELFKTWNNSKLHSNEAHLCHPDGNSPGEHLMPWFFTYGAAHGKTDGGEENEDHHVVGECVFKEYLGSLPMAAYEFQELKTEN